MEGKIKVIVKHPGCVAIAGLVDNTLEAFQKLVTGPIEVVPVTEDLVIICNEEGAIRGLPIQQVLGFPFFGSIVFCGVDGEEFTDVPIKFDAFRKLIEGLT